MDHKALLRLFLLLLAFSVVFSRNLKTTSWDSLSVVQDLHIQGFSRGLLQENESSSIEGRTDFVSADYTGTGANNRHDPKPPGTFEMQN